MDKILEAVREFADRAHGEQQRKYTDERYIVHPIRVMKTCKQYTTDVTTLAAALLHDVLEDTPVTADEMQTFLSRVMPLIQAQKTLQLVVELTDIYVKTSYPEMNRKRRKALEAERLKKTSADAQTVKYADIIDNARDFARYDRDFAIVFTAECLRLLKDMNKGNSELYALAVQTLENIRGELTANN